MQNNNKHHRAGIDVAVTIEVVSHWRNEGRHWSDSKLFDSFPEAAAHFQRTRQRAVNSARDTLVDLVMRQHKRLVVEGVPTDAPVIARR